MTFDRKTRAHRWVMFKLDYPSLSWLHGFLQSTICFFSGHTPERECVNPAHDFCLWCRKSMPNSWMSKGSR